MSEADIRAERVRKIEILKAAGMEAYPAESARDTDIGDFVSNFKEGTKAVLGGRIMSVRGQGGIMFADIFDGTGKTQLVFQKEFLNASPLPVDRNHSQSECRRFSKVRRLLLRSKATQVPRSTLCRG